MTKWAKRKCPKTLQVKCEFVYCFKRRGLCPSFCLRGLPNQRWAVILISMIKTKDFELRIHFLFPPHGRGVLGRCNGREGFLRAMIILFHKPLPPLPEGEGIAQGPGSCDGCHPELRRSMVGKPLRSTLRRSSG